jgi:malonyl-CoA/methylmalonyl-CoA synthetase
MTLASATDARAGGSAENLFSILAGRAPAYSERTFLEPAGGPALTYGTMLEQSGRAARWLSREGIGRGDRIVVQVNKSIPTVLLYLGCLRVGAVFVPLNTAYTAPEVEYFLADADPAMVVAGPGTAAASVPFDGRRTILHDDPSSTPWSGDQALDEISRVEPHDPAAILYTSGTTGRSKGAILTHRNLSSNALVLNDVWRWQQGDVLLHALPIYHAHGLFVALHGAMLNGSAVLFHDKFDAEQVIRDLPRVTVFMGVPTFYTRLLDRADFGRESCRTMRIFISGSAPLLESTFTAFQQRTGHTILERYGMTEAVMVTSNPYEGPRRPGTVGPPLPGVDVRIVDEGGSATAVGEPGTLILKGPNLFAGYWKNPEKTAREHTADGYFVSGDIAVRDPDDFIRIVGRTKDLIITGGFNVYPKEIEVALDALPGVAESAVLGVPHPDFGEGVLALIVPDAGTRIVAAEVARGVEPKLAAFKRPKRIIVVDALPRNAMGKVQKALLRERYGQTFAPITVSNDHEPS